jgi:hypothetical protein
LLSFSNSDSWTSAELAGFQAAEAVALPPYHYGAVFEALP